MKVAFITGITGQDGAYLAEFLLHKGYSVHGLRRNVSVSNLERIAHLDSLAKQLNKEFVLHYGDMADANNILRLLMKIQPDEIYNLAAQSHVQVSFDAPEYTADINALGALRLLESIRILKLEHKTRFYQASTSELFGKVHETPQKETTPFYPRSPYACAKLFAYWITINYREAYNMYACNGILFNHESPVRGENFVTRKITRTLAEIFLGHTCCLHLGNLSAKRDWGHAKDYVEMQWLMLQQDHPEDFVIATGKQFSVRDFVNIAAQQYGISLHWQGQGIDEIGIVDSINQSQFENLLQAKSSIELGQTLVKVDPSFFRPTEVETLLGDSSKAKRKLGWHPRISFQEMVEEMVLADLKLAKLGS